VSPDQLDLPSDPDDLRALVAAMQARLAVSEHELAATREELTAAKNAVVLTTPQIEKLKVALARLRRMKFGQSSERMASQADQLELTLDELEAEQAQAECVIAGKVPGHEPKAPAPALPVPRGRAGPGLLAHVVVSKFADHLPLYRQSRIYAREGVDLSRSTLADWLGQVS
jgi:Transposase IS66 family/Transposase C of IS166 homeodomain